MTDYSRVQSCIRYDDQALPSADFYCSLLPDTGINPVEHDPEGRNMAEPGTVLAVGFTLTGMPCQARNGGPHFTLDEAVLISVSTDDPAETDRLREARIADGAVRLAEGSVRAVLADRAETMGRIGERTEIRRGPIAPHADQRDRHRRAGSRGQGGRTEEEHGLY